MTAEHRKSGLLSYFMSQLRVLRVPELHWVHLKVLTLGIWGQAGGRSCAKSWGYLCSSTRASAYHLGYHHHPRPPVLTTQKCLLTAAGALSRQNYPHCVAVLVAVALREGFQVH